jgi:hypothetical protein
MHKFEDFNQFIETEAIATYLRSFGYKAEVDCDALIVQIQEPKWDTFVIVEISNWDEAREFIKVRAAEL